MHKIIAIGILFLFACNDNPGEKPTSDPNPILVTVTSNSGQVIEQFKCCEYQNENNFIAPDMNYDIRICSDWMIYRDWATKDRWIKTIKSRVKRPMANTSFR